MNCERIKPLLSEFADERLDAATAWQVQMHLSDCADCGRLNREIASMQKMLKALPASGPTAGFDQALAQRLALTRRPAAPVPAASRRLRPALALGAVVGAALWAALYPALYPAPPMISTQTQMPPVAARAADPAFLADCVAQHHRDAAAEPLADLSAQTLAGSLDRGAPADPNTDSSLF